MFLEQPVRVGFMELVELGEVQGQNRCLSEFHAAILLSRLQHLDEELKHREQMAEYMKSRLSQLQGVVPVERTIGTDLRSIYRYCLHIDRTKFMSAKVEAISTALSAELNTTVELLDTPLYRNVLYCPQKSRIFTALWNSKETAAIHQGSLPSAEYVHSTYLTFPHHLFLGTEKDVDDIISAILKVQKHSKKIDILGGHYDGKERHEQQ
jgi:L-glutamine:2-deoxy-scyllo-inosose/3-amino-2,3-dideoxy-scyllo-inosose aminotransferase